MRTVPSERRWLVASSMPARPSGIEAAAASAAQVEAGDNSSSTSPPALLTVALKELYEALWSCGKPATQEGIEPLAADPLSEQWHRLHQRRVLVRYLGGEAHKTYAALVAAHVAILQLTETEVQYVHVIYYSCLIEQQCKQLIADLLKKRLGFSRTTVSRSPARHGSGNPEQEEQEEQRHTQMKQRLQAQITRLQIVHQRHRQQLEARRDYLLQVVLGDVEIISDHSVWDGGPRRYGSACGALR